MNDRLYDILIKLPKRNLINLLWSALDEMQSCNIRSRTQCIMEALGAKCLDEDTQSKWELPNKAEMKRNTDVCGF